MKSAPKTASELGDGDDGDGDEPVIDIEPRPYAFADDTDEERRAFIIEKMGDGNIAGEMLVTNMELVFRWLKSGIVPEKTAKLKITKIG